MIYAIQARLNYTVRRVVGSALGGLLMAIGVGFLTAAGWIYLVDIYGALTAALGIGGGFILLGLIVMLYSRRRRAHVPPPTAGLGALIEAFLAGRAAGTSMRPRSDEED